MAGEGEDLGLLGGDGAEDVEIEEGGEETFGSDDAGAAGDGEAGAEELEGGDKEGSEGGSRAIVKLEPLAIRKALREISSTNPEFAKKFPTLEKAVTTALFKSDQLAKFGGVQAISAAMEALEVHGGPEGIDKLVEYAEASRELEQGFERGDPAVIDGWAKDFPAGFKKLITPALDKLETLDKEHFVAVASYLANKLLGEYGVYSALAAIGEALQGDKKDEAIKQYNLVAKFITDMKGLAGKPKSGRSDQDTELEEGRKSLAQEKRDMVYSSARLDVNPRLMAETNRLLRQLLPRGTKMKVGKANRLRRDINVETRARMNSDSDFHAKFEQLLAAGNKDRLAQFIFTRASKHLPKVVRQIIAEEGLTGKSSGGGSDNGAGARRAAGGEGAARFIAGRPKTGDIDFTRTDKSVWLSTMNSHGTAWLRNGKQAKW